MLNLNYKSETDVVVFKSNFAYNNSLQYNILLTSDLSKITQTATTNVVIDNANFTQFKLIDDCLTNPGSICIDNFGYYVIEFQEVATGNVMYSERMQCLNPNANLYDNEDVVYYVDDINLNATLDCQSLPLCNTIININNNINNLSGDVQTLSATTLNFQSQIDNSNINILSLSGDVQSLSADTISIQNQINNLQLSDLQDVSVSGASDGDVLLYSGGTWINSIFQTSDQVSVQNGINTFTGGTALNPTVNITSATLSDLSVSGSIITNWIGSSKGLFVDFVSQNLSGNTIYSGTTDLYDIFLTQSQIINSPYTGNTLNGSINTISGSNISSGLFSVVAGGTGNTASGNFSFAQGLQVSATGIYSSAIGFKTTASGSYSHAEGGSTTASGTQSHAEGGSTIASGLRSHAEGQQTSGTGTGSHAEGIRTLASGGFGTHAEGGFTTASGNYSHAQGRLTIASGTYSHAEGRQVSATGIASHAEGRQTLASGPHSHAEGYATVSTGNTAHAEGNSTKALGFAAHAEGGVTTASGNYSHAEGAFTTASGKYSHTEGESTTASGMWSHSEGRLTVANNFASHAEGQQTTASGIYSHVGGQKSTASGQTSFVHSSGSTSNANESAILGGISNRLQSTAQRSIILGGQNITGATADTVYGINFTATTGVYAQNLYSGGTNLNDIFAPISGGGTRVGNGINTFTGGTDLNPTVNITSATLSNLTVSGNTSLQSISATTIYSGSTNLSNIFNAKITGLTNNYVPKWNGSAFVNSALADDGNYIGSSNRILGISRTTAGVSYYLQLSNPSSSVQYEYNGSLWNVWSSNSTFQWSCINSMQWSLRNTTGNFNFGNDTSGTAVQLRTINFQNSIITANGIKIGNNTDSATVAGVNSIKAVAGDAYISDSVNWRKLAKENTVTIVTGGTLTVNSTHSIISVKTAPAAINLPAWVQDKEYTIMTDTVPVAINANGADLINGIAAYNLAGGYECVKIIGESPGLWRIVSKF